MSACRAPKEAVIRVAVLWSRLSGYFVDCLAELASRGVELLIVHWPASANAPFRFRDSDLPGTRYLRTDIDRFGRLEDLLRKFDPHAALVSGWMDWLYIRTALVLRRRGVVVIGGMDNQWRGHFKQVIAPICAGWVLRRTFSALWVPGERSEQYARRLGFRGVRLWRGLYCGASKKFHAAGEVRAREWLGRGEWPRRFVFVGRYEDVKGVPELLEAYAKYRELCSEPWELWCAGHGSLKLLVSAARGVRDLGFVQPNGLPSVLADAGCFVLPSRKEPWGVALLEGAASGLPLICSDECGSHVELVREGFNGWVVRAGDAAGLAAAMVRVSSMSPKELSEFGKRSADLALAYTPERWAEYFLEKYSELASSGRRSGRVAG
jgi:glycosyltransferase involved in cell wall biosynthesis